MVRFAFEYVLILGETPACVMQFNQKVDPIWTKDELQYAIRVLLQKLISKIIQELNFKTSI